MFFIKELTHTILMHPSYFGPRMLEMIEAQLHSAVQGTCSGQYGFIIAVLEIIDVGPGVVLPGSGQAEFRIRYKAIVFKPFKGEVLDGVVTNVLRAGFFVEVGPLRCFVSKQLVHADMKFDANAAVPSFASHDQVIEKDTKVRLKVVGTRVDQTEIFAIATIKEDHLGVID
ncbi:DNA-directed RNA polymerase II subunit [Serendipita sp. 396]|nr:DNA-directed RNA polymerase II subunit [Serendipita sp. 396]KAG8788439.1 DNA-directed RNA polymerase II subunit [Serendipita sp. 397]KAG8827278.1 DNA-directed RNA polymerase II subunit [Serendipita sp. 401]KAG8839374.1 DNA-directed RNA polymerase II subunit [Serendipita sp. 400]KAG8858443.1 DNA-directed RNA polymerase II subunit [Serendipita sp. 411]KAG8872903.1 DNA-directed RNA polymerase II subunit [Serendipita sp. 405]KAG9057850.1 DNA-directed RNA polymerase II subunit [Serendipita sp. 